MATLSTPFTTDDALRAGFSAAQIRRRLARGTWTALRPGVMVTSDVLVQLSDRPRQRHALDLKAVMLAVSRPTWASHRSAGFLWDLPVDTVAAPQAPPETAELTAQPGGARTRRYPGVRLLVATLPPAQQAVIGGLALTAGARTVVDLCRHLPTRQALPIADAALFRRLASPAALAEVARGCHRWPGIDSARRTLALADGRRESPLESVSALTFLDLGLPEPEPQVVIATVDGHVIARVDFLWRAQGVVGEADGKLKYAGDREALDQRDVLWAEKRREDGIRDLGLEMFRWTWYETEYQPHVIQGRFERACQRARLRAPAAITAVFARPRVRLGPDMSDLLPQLTCKERAGEQSRRWTA